MADVVRVSSCRLCEGALELVVSFTPTPPGDQYLTEPREQPCYPLDLMVCKDCGAVQLADTVDPKLIYTDYLYTTSVSKGLDTHYEAYADDALGRIQPKSGAFVVDIGSNDGTLLKAFQARGMNVLGVEPCKAIADASGVPTWPSYFRWKSGEGIRTDYGHADLITANHVMANVADLHDFIEGVKTLLAPDGTFVFETGYWPAIMDDNLIDTIEHEHIHYFEVAPLRRFFQRHGLKLVRAERQPTKGGSLRGYVTHADAPANPEMGYVSVALMATAEGLCRERRVQEWVERVQHIEQNVRERIAQSDGDIWVGYGAAVGSTLLLHQFGLGEKLLCLVDANPAKQGRKSPGYHLNVLDPSELAELKPDVIVILAWRYADLIMAQHPEFTGKWLIPLPSVRTA